MRLAPPEGSKKWTQERYDKKLKDISRVISSINKTDLPEIVGLCEVENKKVLDDLIQTDSLVSGSYKIVHHVLQAIALQFVVA